LNNPRLREIEPMVLVDMPGFESTIDGHNKAILEYIDRGCFYIALSSVTDGTMTSSFSIRLREIEGWGREFALFISKADLKPPQDVQDIVEYFQDQLKDNFESSAQVMPLYNNSSEKVMDCLKAIDLNRLFSGLFLEKMNDACDDVIGEINLRISASKKDTASIESLDKEMEESITKLRKQAQSEQESMRRRYSGMAVKDIVAEVGSALEGSVDELCSLVLAGNQSAASNALNEIVRSTVSVAMKEKMAGINKEIAVDFSSSLAGIDMVMKDLDFKQDLSADAGQKAQEAANALSPLLSTGLKAVAGGALGKVILTPLLLPLLPLAPILAPIIGVVSTFLPDLIKNFFGGSKEQQQAEQKAQQKQAVRSKLLTEVFPSIKRKLTGEISAQLDGHVDQMITAASEKMEENINKQREILQAEIAEKSKGVEEAQAKQKQLESIRDDVVSIKNEVLAWGK